MKKALREQCFLVEQDAPYPNPKSSDKILMVEAAGVEPASKNRSSPVSPSADDLLHSLARPPNVRLSRLVDSPS